MSLPEHCVTYCCHYWIQVRECSVWHCSCCESHRRQQHRAASSPLLKKLSTLSSWCVCPSSSSLTSHSQSPSTRIIYWQNYVQTVLNSEGEYTKQSSAQSSMPTTVSGTQLLSNRKPYPMYHWKWYHSIHWIQWRKGPCRLWRYDDGAIYKVYLSYRSNPWTNFDNNGPKSGSSWTDMPLWGCIMKTWNPSPILTTKPSKF